MKILIGLGLIIGGIIFAIWLGGCVMLYGGIMQAVESWGVDNSKVVWGILRAVLCEMGLLPGIIMIWTGIYIGDVDLFEELSSKHIRQWAVYDDEDD